MSPRSHANASERIYAALMRVYPRAFRAQYGDEMVDYFRDRLRDERARAGRIGVAQLWTRALLDLASAAIHEHSVAAESLDMRRPLPTVIPCCKRSCTI